jgi:hypothetical protein
MMSAMTTKTALDPIMYGRDREARYAADARGAGRCDTR